MVPDEVKPGFEIGVPGRPRVPGNGGESRGGGDGEDQAPARRPVADPPDVWPEEPGSDTEEIESPAVVRAAESATVPITDEQSVKLPVKPPKPPKADGSMGLAFKKYSAPSRNLMHKLWWKLIVFFHYFRFGLEWMLLLNWRIRYHRAKHEIHRNWHVQKIMAIVNQKGGSGKTALAVSLVMMFAHVLKRHFTAVDANENAGNTAARLGIRRRDTILLREFLEVCESLVTLETFTGAVAWHPETGVSVIASDDKSNVPFPRYRFERGLQIAKQNSHGVICDCGNGLRYPAVMGSVRLADNLLFAGNVNMANSIDGIESTMARFSEWFPGKVERGIIVIFGERLRRRSQYARQFNRPIERVFLMPRNRIMSKGKMPARVMLYPLRVQVVLMEIIAAILTTDAVEDETERATDQSAMKERR